VRNWAREPALPVISNAGPLMVLAKLNVLHLLQQLYGRVRFPRSVYDEVVVEGMRHGYPDAATLHIFLNQMEWAAEDVDPPSEDRGLPPALMPTDVRSSHLDRGERDVIALALSLGRCRVLIDEAAGRRMARAYGLDVKGSLGVLIEAYHRHILDADRLRLYFAQIARQRDIWINPALVERVARELLGG
jgi:predicted nucleic acid-binding protein